jgi:hypothetical protein
LGQSGVLVVRRLLPVYPNEQTFQRAAARVVWRSISPIKAQSGADIFLKAPSGPPIKHFAGFAAGVPSRIQVLVIV